MPNFFTGKPTRKELEEKLRRQTLRGDRYHALLGDMLDANTRRMQENSQEWKKILDGRYHAEEATYE
jgi:hypothetical protein